MFLESDCKTVLYTGGGAKIFHVVLPGRSELVSKEFFNPKDPSLKSEAQIMEQVKGHARFVQMVGYDLSKGYLVMEYLPKGSLFDFLGRGESISLDLKLQMAKQIAEGLAYLHDLSIFHGDVKSANLLLDDRLDIKICDFGSARNKDEQPIGASTLQWSSPLRVQGGGHVLDEKDDVYSFGVILWELFTGLQPFRDLLDPHIICNILRGRAGEIEKLPADTPPFIKDIIKCCWSEDPRARPSMDVLKNVISDNFLRECVGKKVIDMNMLCLLLGYIDKKEGKSFELVETALEVLANIAQSDRSSVLVNDSVLSKLCALLDDVHPCRTWEHLVKIFNSIALSKEGCKAILKIKPDILNCIPRKASEDILMHFGALRKLIDADRRFRLALIKQALSAEKQPCPALVFRRQQLLPAPVIAARLVR